MISTYGLTMLISMYLLCVSCIFASSVPEYIFHICNCLYLTNEYVIMTLTFAQARPRMTLKLPSSQCFLFYHEGKSPRLRYKCFDVSCEILQRLIHSFDQPVIIVYNKASPSIPLDRILRTYLFLSFE